MFFVCEFSIEEFICYCISYGKGSYVCIYKYIDIKVKGFNVDRDVLNDRKRRDKRWIFFLESSFFFFDYNI